MAQGRCSAVLAVALLVVSCAMAVQGADYVVGGDQGWTKPNGNTIPDSYLSVWATGKTFTEGDNLIFNYGAAHNVLEVTLTDYTGCIITAPLHRYTSGNDTVKLTSGTTYFICGTGGHCDAGQKLTIIAGPAVPGSTTTPKSAASTVATAIHALVAATLASLATIALW